MIPFEDVDDRGEGTISGWTLEQRQRIALNVWLLRIRRFDREMALDTQIFTCRPLRGIYYAKIRGNVQLRPRLCLGPVDADEELTFLERVHKKGGQEDPPRSSSRTPARRRRVEAEPTVRRRKLRPWKEQ